jgi:hypothetical protein
MRITLKRTQYVRLAAYDWKGTHIYPQVVGYVLQSAFETLDGTHHRFHVEANGEPFVQLLEERLLGRGQGQRGEELDEVSKVVSTSSSGGSRLSSR